jgi:Ras-related protein Rab-5C
LQYWINEIGEKCEEDVLIFLCGTKSDLEAERAIKEEVARMFQKETNLHYWIETSALDGTNI